jgi:hypothetical protein
VVTRRLGLVGRPARAAAVLPCSMLQGCIVSAFHAAFVNAMIFAPLLGGVIFQ